MQQISRRLASRVASNGASRMKLRAVHLMSPTDRYLFDVNGYLIVRGVFTAEEIDSANTAIDHHIEAMHERSGKLNLSNAYGVKSSSLKGKRGRFDMGGLLQWDLPHSALFRKMLTHEKLVPYYHTFVGKGYRMDHMPFLIRMEKGSEGHAFHGGAVTPQGEPAWPLAYHHNQGEIRCNLMAVSVALTDTKAGDGGFCVLPGSHKANFPCPPRVLGFEDAKDHVVQPTLHKGDVLLFTEAVTHGTLPWTSENERRAVIYRFSPAGSAYGRGYLEGFDEINGLTEAEKAVLQPPFHPRMDRVLLDEQGQAAPVTPREEHKKVFDQKVFGKNYF